MRICYNVMYTVNIVGSLQIQVISQKSKVKIESKNFLILN